MYGLCGIPSGTRSLNIYLAMGCWNNLTRHIRCTKVIVLYWIQSQVRY